MTGWEFIDGKWSYFEKSGAMVADRAVPASDGESYVIGKDGYLANRKRMLDTNIHDNCQTWRMGQEYLLNAKGDDVIIEKNAWYIRPEFKKFSNKYGDEVSNTTLALVDNKDEGQEIDPKAVVQNFQNLPNRYYFDENGHRVVNIPAMTTYSEIKKVGNDVYLENPGARLRLGATQFHNQ